MFNFLKPYTNIHYQVFIAMKMCTVVIDSQPVFLRPVNFS